MALTQKEAQLLKDMKNEEKLCIEKYARGAQNAADPALRALFSGIEATERSHLETLMKIEKGVVPTPAKGRGGARKAAAPAPAYGKASTAKKKADAYLCSDTLAGEKHASSLYNTSIFEFRDEKIRAVLAGIQQDEQKHGKQIYDYMAANSMMN